MGAITATVNGDPVSVRPSSLRVEDRLGGRSTASFEIADPSESLAITSGMAVTVYAGAALIFGGFIAEGVDLRPLTATGGFLWSVDCIDHHFLADKVIVAKTWTGGPARDLIDDLWGEYLEAEGVLFDYEDHEEGPTLDPLIFPYLPASEVLSQIADLCGWWWRIGHDKVLELRPRATYAAPFVASRDNTMWKSVKVSEGNLEYRNRQYVTGGRQETVEQVESFVGDGTRETFSVGFPVWHKPTVEVKGHGFLSLDGSGDYASSDCSTTITGDFRIDALIRADDWTPSANMNVCGQGASPDYGFGLILVTNGKLRFRYTTDGTTFVNVDSTAALSGVTDGVTDLWIRVTVDVNNGAGGHDVKFYTSVNGVDWSQLGTTVTTAGTITLRNSAAPFCVGINAAGGTSWWQGRIYWCGFYQGIAGTLIAGPDFRTWLDEDTAKVDSKGFTWTLQDDAEITFQPDPLDAFRERTVGIRGVEDGFNWYWNKDSTELSQERGHIPLGPTDEMRVTYYGSYPSVTRLDRAGEQARRAAVDGSTGIVAAVSDNPGAETRAAAAAAAGAKLDLYAQSGRKLTFRTRTPGLVPGMILEADLPVIAAEDLLIEAVEITCPSSEWAEWTVTAVEGPASSTWAEWFARMLRPYADPSAVATSEILTLLEQVSETQAWDESITPTVWACPLPAANRYPAANLYPC
jgi:hypothetical protein